MLPELLWRSSSKVCHRALFYIVAGFVQTRERRSYCSPPATDYCSQASANLRLQARGIRTTASNSHTASRYKRMGKEAANIQTLHRDSLSAWCYVTESLYRNSPLCEDGLQEQGDVAHGSGDMFRVPPLLKNPKKRR